VLSVRHSGAQDHTDAGLGQVDRRVRVFTEALGQLLLEVVDLFDGGGVSLLHDDRQAQLL
jgi:hypothetical protein